MARLACLVPRLQKINQGGWATPSRGTPEQRGYGSEWKRLRKFILERDCYLCQPCQRSDRITSAHAVDHIVPKADGGSDDPANLQAICRDCHAVKTQEESNRYRGGWSGFDGRPSEHRAPAHADNFSPI